MILTKERAIEILKNNFYLSDLLENYFQSEIISLEFVEASGENFTMDFDFIIKSPTYDAVLPLQIDFGRYDEKFKDVNKYEVEDMGLKINIVDIESDTLTELNRENIWCFLFFSKEGR